MNVDVVLVNPMDNTQLRRNLGLKAPPLNLLYLASFLEKRLRKVKILDDNLYGLGFEKIAKIVAGYNPLVVGITAVTATVKTTFCYIKAIKKLLPNALIVIGGPHATFMPEQTLMECAELDVVVRGEGEETLSEIVDTYEVKGLEGLGEVKGITYRKSGVIKENAARPFIENLDSLPFPARHLIPFEAYRVMGSPIGDMITSRGCPFFCGFCSSSRLMGKRYRRRSASNVVDEIEELVYKYEVRDIEFIDDIFTLDRKRVEEIVKAIKERKLDVNFATSSRVDTIDSNLLRMLKNAGLSTIFYGTESGSDRVLRLMEKGITT
ncbi:MAG: B12-binding domain-containing radical SAM protein, partial [Thermoproteota archaeon]